MEQQRKGAVMRPMLLCEVARYVARVAVTAAALLLALSAVPARAHLCDDVWRQHDQLIIKPDTTDLVVKDKAEFNLNMVNKMDRDISCRVKILGESPGFNVTVAPAEGHNVIRTSIRRPP